MRKFISIDGQHGTGKSYIVDRVCGELAARKYHVVKTCEPTDSELGLFARNAENRYKADVLACLFAADRLQHCQQIRKWLEDDRIVISDRYIISGLVLQNMDGVSMEHIREINNGILMPDLSIVLYADSEVIQERLKNKPITRLAKQEQSEKYDRYLQLNSELEKMFPNVYFCPNNTAEEGDAVVKFIKEQLGVW